MWARFFLLFYLLLPNLHVISFPLQNLSPWNFDLWLGSKSESSLLRNVLFPFPSLVLLTISLCIFQWPGQFENMSKWGWLSSHKKEKKREGFFIFPSAGKAVLPPGMRAGLCACSCCLWSLQHMCHSFVLHPSFSRRDGEQQRLAEAPAFDKFWQLPVMLIVSGF